MFSHLPSKKIIFKMVFVFLIEFAPILIFVFSYKYLHIYKATFLLMIATIVSTFFAYIKQKRIPYVGLYVALLTLIFGYITLEYKIPKFIQIRDTIYDLSFALTLLLGLAFNKNILHFTLNSAIQMSKEAWLKITYSWTIFFMLGALANEIIRRNYDLHTWVEYKGWMVFIAIAFGLITGFFFYENEKNK